MNSSNQSVVITPIFQDSNDVPEYVSMNGELYFLLSEAQLIDLKNASNALGFVHQSLFNDYSNSDKKLVYYHELKPLISVLQYPLFQLQEIVSELDSFKFHSNP